MEEGAGIRQEKGVIEGDERRGTKKKKGRRFGQGWVFLTSAFTLHFCHFVKWFLSDFSTVNSLFSHFVLYVLETKN